MVLGDVEIPLKVGKRRVLADIRMAWLRWAIGRWLRRSHAINTTSIMDVKTVDRRSRFFSFQSSLTTRPGSCWLVPSARRPPLIARRKTRTPLGLSNSGRTVMRHELPAPEEILEELADKAALQN